jgi:hypothetical protein
MENRNPKPPIRTFHENVDENVEHAELFIIFGTLANSTLATVQCPGLWITFSVWIPFAQTFSSIDKQFLLFV